MLISVSANKNHSAQLVYCIECQDFSHKSWIFSTARNITLPWWNNPVDLKGNYDLAGSSLNGLLPVLSTVEGSAELITGNPPEESHYSAVVETSHPMHPFMLSGSH